MPIVVDDAIPSAVLTVRYLFLEVGHHEGEHVNWMKYHRFQGLQTS